ncbi:MAG: GIY-YIG nuclease family protein [Patescibacteria group bacterium]
MGTYWVYILTNDLNSVVYIGVTNDLERRVEEHRQKLVPGFATKYNLTKLVHFEDTNDIRSAIEREKQLKGWTRRRKNALIDKSNPHWNDLSPRSDLQDPSLRSG